MNKTQLKTKWGKYADTDKLVDDVSAILTKYNHNNTEYGVCAMLDKYFTAKEPLIVLFQKSEHYIGNLRIKMTKEFEREHSAQDIYNFCRTFSSRVEARSSILTDKDEHGKTFLDYLMVGAKHYTSTNLEDEATQNSLNIVRANLEKFDIAGSTIASAEKLNVFNKYINNIGRVISSTISEESKTLLDSSGGSVKIAVGTKTSRIFNRICTEYKVDKLPKYNSLFAQYADLVSANTRTLDLIISLNPCDYLTMSFGKSWSSCHTIDKTNIRGMESGYHGMYCGGTLSYMLDPSSIITYVIDKDGDVQECGKIYRNMFHYQNYTLIQGRVYPQGNDGATDLYSKFRSFMQDELSKMLGLSENKWTKSSDCCQWTESYGVHYRDYECNDNCTVSYPNEHKDDHNTVTIGEDGICPNCGKRITRESYLTHNVCTPRND